MASTEADPPSSLRQRPLEVAPETFVVRAIQHSLGGSVSTSMNSLVIRAAEPVIVDTGMVTDRATFFEDVFSLVEPDDVRWIYLTHDDDDHSGNVMEALDRCPKAKVVMSWAARGRTCTAFGIPPERVRTVDDGQGLDVGDRTLQAVRPPVYDNAYTRGLFDPTTACTTPPTRSVRRCRRSPWIASTRCRSRCGRRASPSSTTTHCVRGSPWWIR